MRKRYNRANLIILQEERLSLLLDNDLLLCLGFGLLDFSAAHRVRLRLQADIVVEQDLVDLLSLWRADNCLFRLGRLCLLLCILLRSWSTSIFILYDDGKIKSNNITK